MRTSIKRYRDGLIARFLLSLLSVATPMLEHSAVAQTPPPSKSLYGPEWTFTNPRIRRQMSALRPDDERLELTYRFNLKLGEYLKDNCTGGCKVYLPKSPENPLVVEYAKDGTFFKYFADNSVMEVNGSGLTVNEIARRQTRIQRDVFDAMGRFGAYPSKLTYLGYGHINQGLKSAFGKDGLFLVNKLAEAAANPIEAFMYNTERAPPCRVVLHLPPSLQNKYAGLLQHLRDTRASVPSVCTQLTEEIYLSPKGDVWNLGPKSHADNVSTGAYRTRLTDSDVWERRFYPAQQNARQYYLQVLLTDRRTELVRLRTDAGEVIRFNPKEAKRFLYLRPRELVLEYYKYVAEAGLEHLWEEYQAMLSPMYARIHVPPEYRSEIKRQVREMHVRFDTCLGIASMIDRHTGLIRPF